MKDEITPTDKWVFDEEVSECFDDMLHRSIPNYGMMRELCFQIGVGFLDHGSHLLDIGCSSGGSLKQFKDEIGDAIRYTGLELSDPMIRIANKNLDTENNSNINILKHDLRDGIPFESKSDLILSILTIQFIPIEYRQKIIQGVFDNLHEGGAFIFVEKILGSDFNSNQLLTHVYHCMKRNNGYTDDTDSEYLMRRYELTYESSQGLLLDKDIGFFPNVTPSNLGTKNIANDLNTVYWVTRCYQTRHGNGAMSNQGDDRLLIRNDPMETNRTNPNQGEFRRSILDMDFIKYSRGKDDWDGKEVLVITCMDHMDEYGFTNNGRLRRFINGNDFAKSVGELLNIDEILVSNNHKFERI